MNEHDVSEYAFKNGFDRGVQSMAERLKEYITPPNPAIRIIDDVVKELTRSVSVKDTIYPDNLLAELCIKDVNDSTKKNLQLLMYEELSTEETRAIEMRYKYKMLFNEIANVIGCSKAGARGKVERAVLKLMDKKDMIRYGVKSDDNT